MAKVGRVSAGIAALALATALAGCSTGGSTTGPTSAPSGPATSPSSSPATGSAPTAGSASPSNVAADWTTYHHDPARTGVTTGVAPFGSAGALRRAWTAQLDGAVYGEPLVIGSRVVVATENDSLYALDAATGAVLWRQHVGTPATPTQLPCGDIDPLGITSTPVYDPATGRVFALAETSGGQHLLVGVDVMTGRVAVRVPVTLPRGTQSAFQQRAALALVGGRVYIPFGGLYGDCGSYDGSDSVVALSPGLSRLDYFAPSSWASDNLRDKDLGSLTPAVVGSYVYADGKSGTAYTMRLGHLGGIGGQVFARTVCRAFGTAAVAGSIVYVPCTDGTRAVSIGADGSITVRWHASVTARGSPVVGGGVVWVVDYSAGRLYALDPATGAVRAGVAIGAGPHFASLSLSGTRAFVGTLTGVVAVSGA